MLRHQPAEPSALTILLSAPAYNFADCLADAVFPCLPVTVQPSLLDDLTENI